MTNSLNFNSKHAYPGNTNDFMFVVPLALLQNATCSFYSLFSVLQVLFSYFAGLKMPDSPDSPPQVLGFFNEGY